MLILGESHLRAVLAEYQEHYNTASPHQGTAQHVPDDDRDAPCDTAGDLDAERMCPFTGYWRVTSPDVLSYADSTSEGSASLRVRPHP